jgi:hypothetical protein
MIGFDDLASRYESDGALVSLAVVVWSAYGATVRDRGAGSEAGWAGRCYALS